MSERIVIGVDTREVSGSIVEWLRCRFVRADPASDATIEIVTVAEVGWIPAGTADDDYRNAYEQALWASARVLKDAFPAVEIAQTLVWGLPAEQLVVASGRADVLLLGSDTTGHIVGLVTGALPLRVAARSECPTIIVPSHRDVEQTSVVVGMSLHPTDDALVSFAVREALRAECALRLVHALPLPQGLVLADLIAPAVRDRLRESAEAGLSRLVDELRAEYPAIEVTALVSERPAAPALLAEARGAHLLVLGSHAASTHHNGGLGSVCHDVVLNASSPVAVVARRGAPA